MTGEILYAVQQELLTFYQGQPCTVIKRNKFSPDKWPTYAMPLFTIEQMPGEEFAQLIGGRTKVDWDFELSAYNYLPDPSGMDPTGFSASRINVFDDLYIHFCTYSLFVSDELKAAVPLYGLTWTLGTVMEADPLEHPDGMVEGYKVRFSVLGWEVRTDGTQEIKPLNQVNQVDPPPAH